MHVSLTGNFISGSCLKISLHIPVPLVHIYFYMFLSVGISSTKLQKLENCIYSFDPKLFHFSSHFSKNIKSIRETLHLYYHFTFLPQEFFTLIRKKPSPWQMKNLPYPFTWKSPTVLQRIRRLLKRIIRSLRGLIPMIILLLQRLKLLR